MFEGDFTITVVPLQKQQRGSDSVATSLLHGNTPGNYKQSLLQPHPTFEIYSCNTSCWWYY